MKYKYSILKMLPFEPMAFTKEHQQRTENNGTESKVLFSDIKLNYW